MKLSVALATYNEADNIIKCLNSVRDLAAEIVVVDGGSTDQTVALAKQMGAYVVETDNPLIFHINKQKALDICRGPWILQLDADEVVTPSLAKEIKAVISMNDRELEKRFVNPQFKQLLLRHQQLLAQRDGPIGREMGNYVAFFLPRRNYFLGKPLTHAGAYPDGVIRLVRKGFAKFPCKSVHEQIQVNGRIGWLYSDLLHYSSATFMRYLTAANKYTSLLAEELGKKSNRESLILLFEYLLIRPVLTFINLFVRHKGILDGLAGFLFSLFSALHYPIAVIKYVARH